MSAASPPRTAARRGRSAARSSGRTALLAGATGLIGRELLPLLQASPAYAQVHVLARRAPAGLAPDARLALQVVDFAALPELPPVDDCYIALGTTIRQAGSQAAFRTVDFDHVVNTARAARAAGATRLAIVSAHGADARALVFYSRVKGEMEAAVAQLGFDSVVIAQPSLLLGDRQAIGQPARAGEGLAATLLGPVMWLVPKALRPIAARAVATALVTATVAGTPGVQRLSSAQMQP